MQNWMRGESASARGSDRGSDRGGDTALRLHDNADRAPESSEAKDLEAKLKNAQKSLQEVQQELDDHRKREAEMKHKKKTTMPGGNEIQHALMQDLRDLRDYCVEVEKAKIEQEEQAKDAVSKLKTEQQQRQDDIRARHDSEKMQADLQRRIDDLTTEIKTSSETLNISNKDTAEMRKLLNMIQSERDETLELLRRAVTQKEKLKGERQRESQEATVRYERLVDQQKNSDTKVRELLGSVDTLLGRFSMEKEQARSSQSGSVGVQLELMKIRDSIRFLLKANDTDAPRQTGGQMAKKR